MSQVKRTKGKHKNRRDHPWKGGRRFCARPWQKPVTPVKP